MKISEKYLSRLEGAISNLPYLYNFLKKIKVRYQRLKYRVFKLGDNPIDKMFDRSFFDKNLEWNIPIASKMVDIFIQYFHPKSVVDVGCGNAEFLFQFQTKGIAIKGYEGSRHALEKSMVDRRFVELFDLRNEIISKGRYDLAICLEVAEHIENKFSQRLVENLTNLSDNIIFTAATPGQGGHFHMNEQPREFWINLFWSRNFIIDDKTTEELKEGMKDNNILSWYCENIMVFKRR